THPRKVPSLYFLQRGARKTSCLHDPRPHLASRQPDAQRDEDGSAADQWEGAPTVRTPARAGRVARIGSPGGAGLSRQSDRRGIVCPGPCHRGAGPLVLVRRRPVLCTFGILDHGDLTRLQRVTLLFPQFLCSACAAYLSAFLRFACTGFLGWAQVQSLGYPLIPAVSTESTAALVVLHESERGLVQRFLLQCRMDRIQPFLVAGHRRAILSGLAGDRHDLQSAHTGHCVPNAYYLCTSSAGRVPVA